MKKVTVSAPGKLMLLGEHAVVYNRPCLVTAVGQRMRATVELIDTPDFILNAPDVGVENFRKPISELEMGETPKGARFVEMAVSNFYKIHKLDGGVKVETNSEFSSLFGFGSSSAATVCTIKALSEIYDLKMSSGEIFDIAYETIMDIQGKGSGFDVAAAAFGGTLYFVTAGKVMEPLHLREVPIIVGYSGIKADTVSLINSVAERAKKYPEVVEGIYNNISMLVERAKSAMLRNDWKTVGELMNINQGDLESLGVSADKLERMIYAARAAGAYGAKLSGAGGGDCIIAVAPPDKTKSVKDAITSAGGQIIEVKTGVEGARAESIS